MAANNIKGLTVEIGGDTTKLGKALEDVNKKSSGLSRELGEINRLLKLDPGNTELLTQKQKVLADAISNTRAKLDTLKEAEKQVQQQFERGEISEEQYRSLQREIIATENKLNGYEGALKETEDALDEVDKKTKETTESSGKFGEALKVAAAAAAAAIAAAGAAALALGKSVVSGFADYEQLVGGVDTLFKESSSKVQTYAENAYKTAGMSANEYMETVTSFSASLISSLGGDTAKAAEYADMAITDMSDNANKMGTDIGSIQHAYQGFAKQNYTMLDNLKLGYGGTQEEMKRLLEDATAISGIEYDISSYADVVDAIHVIQTEMGVTGTTAKEAEKTISGSISTLQGSLNNLVAGLGNADADVAGLAQNVIDAFKNVVTNITPVIDNLVAALPEVMNAVLVAVQDILPGLLETVSDLIGSVLEMLVSVVPSLTSTVAGAVIQIVGTLVEQLPTILEAIVQIITSVIGALTEALPDIIAAVVAVIPKLVVSLVSHIPDILQAAITLLMAIVQAIPTIITELVAALPDIIDATITALLEALPLLVNAAVQLFNAMVLAIPIIIPAIVAALPQIINSLVNGLIDAVPLLIEASITLLMAIVEAIPTIVVALVEAVPQIIVAIVEGLANLATSLWSECLLPAINKVGEWVGQLVENAKQAGTDFLAKIVEFFSTLPEKLGYWLGYAIGTAIKWAKELPEKAKTAASNFLTTITTFFTQLPGKISSFLTNALNKVISWAKDMPAKAKTAASNTLNAVVNGLKNLPSKVLSIGKNMVEGLWNGIKNMTTWITNKVKDFAKGVLGGIKAALGIKSPSKEMAWVGEMMDRGLAGGIEDNAKKPLAAMAGLANDLLGEAGSLNGVTLERRINTNYTNAAQAAAETNLLGRLDKILSAIEKGQILAIDGDALVGATAAKLDNALGQRRLLTARGAL